MFLFQIPNEWRTVFLTIAMGVGYIPKCLANEQRNLLVAVKELFPTSDHALFKKFTLFMQVFSTFSNHCARQWLKLCWTTVFYIVPKTVCVFLGVLS